MDRASAADINAILVDSYVKLHHSIDVARRGYGGAEFHAYCRAAGKALGYMLLDLMEPIYGQFPELMPEWMKEAELNLEQPVEIQTRSDARQRVLELMDGISAELERAATLFVGTSAGFEAQHRDERFRGVIECVAEAKSSLANAPIGKEEEL